MIGSCGWTSRCTSYYPRFIVSQTEIRTKTFFTSVSIKQVKRSDADFWKIIYIGQSLDQTVPINSCQLKVICKYWTLYKANNCWNITLYSLSLSLFLSLSLSLFLSYF